MSEEILVCFGTGKFSFCPAVGPAYLHYAASGSALLLQLCPKISMGWIEQRMSMGNHKPQAHLVKQSQSSQRLGLCPVPLTALNHSWFSGHRSIEKQRRESKPLSVWKSFVHFHLLPRFWHSWGIPNTLQNQVTGKKDFQCKGRNLG